MRKVLFFLVLVMFSSVMYANAQPKQTKQVKQSEQKKPQDNKEKLVIVWTSGDREVALKMVFMYTLNSRKYGWWNDITLVVWGPSAKLLSEDKELQAYIKEIKDAGVDLKACKMCADMYGVSGKLEEMGITVKYMGELTDYIKEGRNILTF
jgi:hypothetical protein